jgi:hypothetical protein
VIVVSRWFSLRRRQHILNLLEHVFGLFQYSLRRGSRTLLGGIALLRLRDLQGGITLRRLVALLGGIALRRLETRLG